jgi:16S rRNA (uracil1498-N3)-methyltransferase
LAQLQRLVVTPAQIQADRITLDQAQLHYLGRVLRLKSGDRFIALDGQGKTWLVTLNHDHADILESLIVESELPIPITLAIALPKNGFDDVIRQVTELGVYKIIPIISDRTLLKPSNSKLDRWQKIIQEASEQSERAIVPIILEPIEWKHYLKSQDNNINHSFTTRLFCWERGDSPSLLQSLANHAPTIEIAIGPEGGWTEAEVKAAIAAGYQPISLGKRILRAVTADVAVMAIVAAYLES